MTHQLTHFAIYIEEIERASKFYETVFNWGFNDYGTPDFLQIKSEEGKVIGALQHRKYSAVKERVIGFECTIGVENVEELTKTIEKAGGKILMPKTEIPQVGWIIKFEDTEGNVVCAMQYQEHVLAAMKS